MKIDLTLAFQHGAQGARSVNFISFCHVMLRFYDAKMIKQYNYQGSFEQFVQACLWLPNKQFMKSFKGEYNHYKISKLRQSIETVNLSKLPKDKAYEESISFL